MDSTSVSLLNRLKQPDHDAAWQRFVELYAPLIFYWGRKHGLSVADTSDLVQEVLSVLVAKLPAFRYDPSKRFRGWLRTVTLNHATDLHRRNSHRPGNGDQGAIEFVTAADEVDLFEETEYRRFLLNRAMEIMRAEFRDEVWKAFWKQTVEGRKAADVAQEMELPLNVVYLAKSRVLKRLREELSGLME